jgi:cytochrome c oxidase assembly factor CtaG/cytochrome c2
MLALFFVLASICSAHEGEPLQPHDLWSAWVFAPGIAIPLLISGLWYLLGTRRAVGLRTWDISCFWTGWISLVIALVSPLHPLGEALFSAHMAQHELLMVVAAPLLVLGRPIVAFLWALPLSLRRWSGRAMKATVPQHIWRTLTDPFGAWLLHAVVLWGWHIPRLFQATLTSDAIHSAQHISFLGSALLFWWALFRHMRYGSAILYVFTTAVHTSLLGALLTFSPQIWYPAYAPRTAVWGFTPLEDQQLGGLIMWVPAGLTYIIAGLWLVALWLKQSSVAAFSIDSADHRVQERTRNAATITLLLCACCLWATSSACRRHEVLNNASILTGGNPQTGQQKLEYYGCPACHTIPGVRGADGLVGPPLTRVASRVYIAGVLPNTPENMVRWLEDPPAVDKLTAMPNMRIPVSDARDIAAYLYTLQ